MRASALVDTGVLLAVLDRSDRWHSACARAWRENRLPLLTSEAVLTELFHLTGESGTQVEGAWRLVRSGAIVPGTIEAAELPEIEALMSRYADRPMDFADATLVCLARREGLSTILTIDHSDFETYRIEGRKAFRIIPGRRQ